MNLLVSGDRQIRLEPRHVDLLVLLARHAGQVVGTDELLARVWQGQLVGDHSIYQAVAKLRRALGDDAASPSFIETVPKRGYRLIAEVVADPPPATPRNPAVAAPAERRQTVVAPWLTAALLLAVLTGSLGWWLLGSDRAAELERPRSVAVLPFASLSDDPADRFVAEGFAIELGNLLGGIDALQVVGPVSARTASEEHLALAELGRRLGADVVVAGSLRRAGATLRIAGALTDTATGRQLWSAVYERDAADVFAVQTEIAGALALALRQVVLGQPGAALAGATAHGAEAYDHYLLGQYYRSRRTPVDLQRAREHYARAVAEEPAYADAKRGLAATWLLLAFYSELPLTEALAHAERPLAEALLADPDDAALQATIGLSHYLQGAFGQAEESLLRAVEVGPNLAEAWMWLGLSRRQQGRLHDALTAFEHARSLEPLMVVAAVNTANALAWSGDIGAARQVLDRVAATVDDQPQLLRALSAIALEAGDLGEAYQWARKALDLNPDSVLSKANLGMVYAYLGRRATAARLLRDAAGDSVPGRAVQRYLDRASVVAPGLLPRVPGAALLARLQDEANAPEIDWRAANARTGLAAYFAGEPGLAATRLARALEGRTFPIERTDYDAFLCTVLSDALGRSGSAGEAARWLARCEQEVAEATQRGWDSLALGYARLRLAVLQGAGDTTVFDAVDSLVSRGFRNRQLLLDDPVFEPLREVPRFSALRDRIDALVAADWSEIEQRSE